MPKDPCRPRTPEEVSEALTTLLHDENAQAYVNSRYYDPDAGVCVVVARDCDEAEALVAWYDSRKSPRVES